MKKNKNSILMVYPKYPVSYWSYKYSLQFIGKKAALPPLGLITIASLLPQNYTSKLIDLNITKLTDEEIKKHDLIFVSAMIIQKDSFNEVINQCSKLGKPIIAGGPYPTNEYKTLSNIDTIVLGEAENLIKNIIEDWEKGSLKKIYKAEERPSMADSPIPRFDLLDRKSYHSMSIQYSRGCPFNCEFCNIISLFGRKMRCKSELQVLKELDTLFDLNWKGPLFIVDDNFIGNKKETYNILAAIAKWQKSKNYPFSLYTEASVNLADDQKLLVLFKDAGFNMVFLGIETPSENALKEAGKIQNIKTNIMSKIENIQKIGIEVTAGFIVGFDSDKEDIFNRQIDFINKSGIMVAMVGLLQALPGTRLFTRLKKEGRITGESYGDNTNNLSLNFKSNIHPTILINGYRKILKQIYDPAQYYKRALTFLKRSTHYKGGAVKINILSKLRAAGMSVFKQTFSSYGHYYLLFLLKSMFINPRLLPAAFTISIQGYHFFKITKMTLATANKN